MNNVRSTIGYMQKSNRKVTTPRSYSKKRLKSNEQERFSFINADFGGRKQSKAKKRNYINHSKVEDYLKNISKSLNVFGYPQKVKKGSLKIASQNFFEKMFVFLVSKIDPNFQVKEDFRPEELIEIMDNFGYSDGISENIFQSIGIPSNWNVLLGVIDDLCKNVKNIQQIQNVILEDNQNDCFSQVGIIQRNVLFEIIKIQKKQDSEKAINDQLDKEISRQQQQLQQKELTFQNLVMKFDNQKQQQIPLEELQYQIENKKIKNENLSLNLDKQKNEIMQLKNDLEDLQKQAKLLQQDKDDVELKVRNLQKIIDDQGMTKEQTDIIEQENIDLKKQIEQIQKKIDDMINQHTDSTDKFNTYQIQFLDDWQILTKEYNLKNFYINDFKKNFDESARIASQQIEQTRQQINTEINNTQSLIQKKQQEFEKVNQEIFQLENQLQNLQQEVNEAKSQLANQLKTNKEFTNQKNIQNSKFDQEINKYKVQLEELKQQISKLLQEEQNYKNNIEQLHEQIQQQENDNQEVEDEFYQQKQKDIYYLKNYKLKMKKILKRELIQYQENKKFFEELY